MFTSCKFEQCLNHQRILRQFNKTLHLFLTPKYKGWTNKCHLKKLSLKILPTRKKSIVLVTKEY